MSSLVVRKQINSNQKDSISDFICPTNGFRGAQARKGVVPKDHMKDNFRDLKQRESILREKKEMASQPERELYKLSQFKNVSSKLHEQPDRLMVRRNSFDGSKEFLAKGISDRRRDEMALENRQSRLELDRKMEEAKYYAGSSDAPESPRKSSIPREMATLAPPTNTDFISRNRVKAMTMVSAAKTDDASRADAGAYKHEEYGRVPEYLEERKARKMREEEEERRRRPDPSCPPGMVLMPEHERLHTLGVLTQSREEALNQLQRLPFVIETPSMKRKQETLETKLREIDRAMGIFSKDKVYVASK